MSKQPAHALARLLGPRVSHLAAATLRRASRLPGRLFPAALSALLGAAVIAGAFLLRRPDLRQPPAPACSPAVRLAGGALDAPAPRPAARGGQRAGGPEVGAARSPVARLEVGDEPTPEPLLTARPAATPEPSPTAQPTPTPRPVTIYQVAAGDTLAGLAARFGISVDTIVWANDLASASEGLRVGQRLIILPTSGVLHKVKQGDTLLAIAFRYEVSPEAIIEENRLADPDVLSIDQQLIIPNGRRAPPPAPAPRIEGPEHVVAAGETVEAIARRYGVDQGELVRANGLSNPDMIRVGQRLVIPGAVPAAVGGPAPGDPTATPTDNPSPGPATPTPAAANKGQEIVAVARRYLGYRYTWGGHAPATGFDCSGFAWYVCQQAGVAIPMHDLWGQIGAGPTVKRSELRPGDLVFFQNTFRAGLSHVGIYIGDGRFVHANNEETGVRIDSLDSAYWDVRYYGASRPWE